MPDEILVEKASETEVKISTPQPNLEETKSKDQLLADKQRNTETIDRLQKENEKLDVILAKVEELNIKSEPMRNFPPLPEDLPVQEQIPVEQQNFAEQTINEQLPVEEQNVVDTSQSVV